MKDNKLKRFIKAKLLGVGLMLFIVLVCIGIYYLWQFLGTLSFQTVGISAFIVLFIILNWLMLDDYDNSYGHILVTEFFSILLAFVFAGMFIMPVWVDNVLEEANVCDTLDDRFNWATECNREVPVMVDKNYLEKKKYNLPLGGKTYTNSAGQVIHNYNIILDLDLVKEVCFNNIPNSSRLHDDKKYPVSFKDYTDLRDIKGFWCKFNGGTYDLGELIYIDWNDFIKQYKEVEQE